jgi:hypothetical protein
MLIMNVYAGNLATRTLSSLETRSWMRTRRLLAETTSARFGRLLQSADWAKGLSTPLRRGLEALSFQPGFAAERRLEGNIRLHMLDQVSVIP